MRRTTDCFQPIPPMRRSPGAEPAPPRAQTAAATALSVRARQGRRFRTPWTTVSSACTSFRRADPRRAAWLRNFCSHDCATLQELGKTGSLRSGNSMRASQGTAHLVRSSVERLLASATAREWRWTALRMGRSFTMARKPKELSSKLPLRRFGKSRWGAARRPVALPRRPL